MGRRGFTLFEVVLALALAGLFVYGGVYSFQRLVPKFQLQSGIWEVTSGLNRARFRAIMSGAPVRVRFVSSGFLFERFDGAASIYVSNSLGAYRVTIAISGRVKATRVS
jgi:prepilin-type N-terminal cleavage/methylation domain-containing protein